MGRGGVTSPLTVTQPHPPATAPPPRSHSPSDSIQLLCSLYRTVNDSLFFHVFYCQLYSMKVFIYFIIDRLQFIWFTFDCSCESHSVSILSQRSCKLLLSYSPAYIKTGGWARPQVETGLGVPWFYLYLY